MTHVICIIKVKKDNNLQVCNFKNFHDSLKLRLLIHSCQTTFRLVIEYSLQNDHFFQVANILDSFLNHYKPNREFNSYDIYLR